MNNYGTELGNSWLLNRKKCWQMLGVSHKKEADKSGIIEPPPQRCPFVPVNKTSIPSRVADSSSISTMFRFISLSTIFTASVWEKQGCTEHQRRERAWLQARRSNPLDWNIPTGHSEELQAALHREHHCTTAAIRKLQGHRCRNTHQLLWISQFKYAGDEAEVWQPWAQKTHLVRELMHNEFRLTEIHMPICALDCPSRLIMSNW